MTGVTVWGNGGNDDYGRKVDGGGLRKIGRPARRQIAHNLLKLESTLKAGSRGKCLNAGGREDYRLKVLLVKIAIARGEISGESPEKINFAAGYCNALTAML